MADTSISTKELIIKNTTIPGRDMVCIGFMIKSIVIKTGITIKTIMDWIRIRNILHIIFIPAAFSVRDRAIAGHLTEPRNMTEDKKEAEYACDILQAIELTQHQGTADGQSSKKRQRGIDIMKANAIDRTGDMNHIMAMKWGMYARRQRMRKRWRNGRQTSRISAIWGASA